MQAGQVAQEGDAQIVFRRPRHPYTQALLKAALDLSADESGAVAG